MQGRKKKVIILKEFKKNTLKNLTSVNSILTDRVFLASTKEV
jgi:hypothetical protein